VALNLFCTKFAAIWQGKSLWSNLIQATCAPAKASIAWFSMSYCQSWCWRPGACSISFTWLCFGQKQGKIQPMPWFILATWLYFSQHLSSCLERQKRKCRPFWHTCRQRTWLMRGHAVDPYSAVKCWWSEVIVPTLWTRDLSYDVFAKYVISYLTRFTVLNKLGRNLRLQNLPFLPFFGLVRQISSQQRPFSEPPMLLYNTC